MIFVQSGNSCQVVKVYALSTVDGTLQWDSGNIASTASMGADYSTPAIANGQLYFAVGNALYAFGPPQVIPPPHIENVSPSSNPPGSVVIIDGENFSSTLGTVRVCSTTAEVAHWEDPMIAIVVPEIPLETLCQVEVTTQAGSSNMVEFRVIPPSAISGFIKNESGKGIKGVQVFVAAGVTGVVPTTSNGSYSKSGLSNGQYTVQPVLSGYLFTHESQSITIDGSSVSNVNFTGAHVVPLISGVSPQQGVPNTRVSITGSGFGSFDASVNKVKFGSTDAAIQSWRNSKIEVLAPPGTGSVLVTVVTASGISNSESFTYTPPPRPKNVRLIPSGDFQVLIFKDLQTISSDRSSVVAEISIENITGAWYVVRVGTVGGVIGPDLPTEDFMMGPCDVFSTCDIKSLGRITFPKKSQLSFSADNSIDLVTCPPCDLQTRRILSALAMELIWRMVFGSPYPVTESARIVLFAELALNNPVVNLGIEIWQGDILGIMNTLPAALADPGVTALLAKYGYSFEPLDWITGYIKAAQIARLLIDTLIYPHVGQLFFDAK